LIIADPRRNERQVERRHPGGGAVGALDSGDSPPAVAEREARGRAVAAELVAGVPELAERSPEQVAR
jgi:hypothetical protein